MKCSSPSKIDRLTHDNFVSSLRTWCNSDTESNPSITDLNVAWINQISERLLVGAKVDLSKVVTLDRLSRVEVDFLKLAVPNLAYFAKTPRSSTTNESSLQLLKTWTGVPMLLTDSDISAKSLLVNKLKFKNVILKLLANASNDKRIRRMQSFIINPTEMDLSTTTSSDDEDVTPSYTSNDLNSPQSSGTNRCKQCNDASPNGSLRKSPQNNAVTVNPASAQNEGVSTPNATELLSLCNRRRVPKLHIEYVEPTPDLLSSNYVNFRNKSRRYYHHNCFSNEPKDAKWVESLRGGYIPSHFRFNS
ncbi:hypothetical protein MACJ_003041 [Theileria orientalis]|uniref:Uncharacterized protein n=1 Tax=Theileria orientalis TaxID=68886 RepID=A0A976M793_THEOR|nr:hypothetical protein MACJ_003041 [Theileria orientalis]